MKITTIIKASILSLILAAGSATAFAQEDDDDGSLVLSFAGIASERANESSYDYGLGALIEANVNDHFGIETGALFIKRESELFNSGGAELTQTVSRLHIPVLARFWVADYFSVAAGPFVEFKTGDVKTSGSIGGVGGSVETSADDSTQFGLDAAATLNFAVADKTGIFVEARYSMFFDEEDDEEFNKMFYLAGVKLDL